MKKFATILIISACIVLLSGCGGKGVKKNDQSTDLVTIKTLGLAYLEEFRHDEAEKQFLSFIKLAPGEKFGYANLGLTYLRMGRYEEAKKQLETAKKIDPNDPDIRLIMATVYQMNDERDKAIAELKEALVFAPSHAKILYQLTEILAADKQATDERKSFLVRLSESTPANLVPILNLTELYIKSGERDQANLEMKKVLQQFPELPKEASEFYDKTMALIAKGDYENAVIQFTIFHNYLKVTAPYQSGILELKGPGGSLIGFPLITFDRPNPANMGEGIQGSTTIKFTDVTTSAGLDLAKPAGTSRGNKTHGHVTTADFDNDGDIDIYFGSPGNLSGEYSHFLMLNETGVFRDITSTAALEHSGQESDAVFVDYDNDGFLDIFVSREEGDLLYRNSDKGLYKDVTSVSGLGKSGGDHKALFIDADQDGDLDLFLLGKGKNLFFRNNGDGTFIETGEKTGISQTATNSTDAAFGDFDEDGDLDFVVAHESGNPELYSNQRQGVFRDIAKNAGLSVVKGAGAIATGDYNNDGYLDLFFATNDGTENYLMVNMKNGTFKRDDKQPGLNSASGFKASDACFFDYDNDGFNDILLAGESSTPGERGLFLFRNDGKGGFTDESGILPSPMPDAYEISLFDYNDDGDLDILIARKNGGISLLRNDGGNNNHFIKMKLVGLRTGSAKNNFYGIGAKVEMRAGDLYNTMVVTDPNIHFGIGNRQRADVIRITWTNGVPQNIFLPGSDQAIVESQILKGSCPFLYTWNGNEYLFAKDIIWRSALGMPLGIMGETTAYAFADASDDYLKIDSESLKPENGKYLVQVTSELWETIYTDKIELVAVDHPASSDIQVPEQFSPPPFPGMKLFTVSNKITPVSAIDQEGNNMLPFISEHDFVFTPGYKPGRYQGITERKELVLDPGKLPVSGNIILCMNGWIFPTDASINMALSQTDKIQLIQPEIQVMDREGRWVAVDHPGFPMGKDKTVIADLTGKFLSGDHRVRIVTNLDVHWDQIYFAEKNTSGPTVVTKLSPVSGDLHYRGFSAMFRKGGDNGPHWFNYNKVEKEPRWRDLTGYYTRYGDVLPLLQESDNKYIISNAGDEVSISFDAGQLPPLEKGWKRDFLIHSVGWVKDGDLNTATGNTVLPLPFHGMKSYPPASSDKYPGTPDLLEYNAKYNTRLVTNDSYISALRQNLKKK
ncbi:MAG: FG-GAP-like repeat-containing protein [Bacteroidales bacterium]